MIGCGTLLAIGVVVMIFIGMYVSAVNTEVSLRAQFDAKQRQATIVYDQMWKIIEEQAGVAASYRDSFGEIYNDMISGRYEHGGGQMMQWITESNPDYDVSLSADLMASIEAQRTISTNVQSELLAIVQQHTEHTSKIPNNFFVGGRCCLDAQIVTSTRTEESFASGVDNETMDFGNMGQPQAGEGE